MVAQITRHRRGSTRARCDFTRLCQSRQRWRDYRTVVLVLGLLMSNTGPARAQEFATFPVRGQGLRSTQFAAGGYSCTVAVVGNGTCTSASGPSWKFKLPAESRDAVFDVVYPMADGDGILLCWNSKTQR